MAMSDFNRIDRPEDRTKGDRFARFKATTDAIIRYREAYFAAQQAGAGLAGLPHPDGDEYDAEDALAKLQTRSLPPWPTPDPLRAVPPIDITGGRGASPASRPS
jgi:hypothetical protein